MMEKEKYTDYVPDEKQYDTKPNLRDLVSSTFFIESYELGESKNKQTGNSYKWANITTNMGIFHTASQRIIRQLKMMDNTLLSGKSVRVKLVAEGISLRFVSP